MLFVRHFGIWVLYHTRMNIICNMIVWYILLYYIYLYITIYSRYHDDLMWRGGEHQWNPSNNNSLQRLVRDFNMRVAYHVHHRVLKHVLIHHALPGFLCCNLDLRSAQQRKHCWGIQVIQHLQAARLALCQIEKTNWPTTRLVKWCWKWHQSNWPQKNLPTYLNMYPRHEFFSPGYRCLGCGWHELLQRENVWQLRSWQV